MKESVLKKIRDSLEDVPDLYSAYLFGSHAEGRDDESSDIDLVVILDMKGFAKDYREYLSRRQRVSRILRNLRMEYGLDLLVYTRDEWEFLVSRDNSLVRSITEKGLAVS